MRAKKFAKRLNLNKKTIANLNKSKLAVLYGGFGTVPPKCIPQATRSCPTNNSDAGGACCCGDLSFNEC
jgi:hypothetical protein